jgi:cyclohexyl-isocyanide hydratase
MTIEIGMLLFPGLTQLDLTGPHEVLARVPETRVRLVARTLDPARAETGITILPDATFDEVTQLDVLFVPGGAGQIAAGEDGDTLGFLRRVGATATWVTSACTGSLLLGAAGLLRGYRAATHWAFMDLLPLVGAIPTDQRVVTDRNRITGGGVTAGLDIALTIAAALAGRELAERIQLGLEYDPHPPFQSGHPNVARRELVAEVRASMTERYAMRREQLERLAGESLRGSD